MVTTLPPIAIPSCTQDQTSTSTTPICTQEQNSQTTTVDVSVTATLQLFKDYPENAKAK